MRTIERTNQFKRDFKREVKGRHGPPLVEALNVTLIKLVNDEPLESRYRDHALGGDWKDHRDCHIRPDLVLLYRKPNDEVLQLVRLGSHSELGL